MKKYNLSKNVEEASYERIDFIFKNFNKIYLSFSGGKDSGVMLNLTLQYMRDNNITKKIPQETKKTFFVSLAFGGLRMYTNIIIIDQNTIKMNQPVKKAI